MPAKEVIQEVVCDPMNLSTGCRRHGKRATAFRWRLPLRRILVLGQITPLGQLHPQYERRQQRSGVEGFRGASVHLSCLGLHAIGWRS